MAPMFRGSLLQLLAEQSLKKEQKKQQATRGHSF
jgi:hypothetical protein